MLMSVDDIVSMVKSKGAQLKLAEKKRQLSSFQPAVTASSHVVSIAVVYYFIDTILENAMHCGMSLSE